MPIVYEPEELWKPNYPDPDIPPITGPLKEPPEIPSYHLVAHERIPIARVSLAGLISAPFWLAAFVLLSFVLGGPQRIHIEITIAGVVLGVLILLFLVPLLHEAVHGMAALLLGAKPRYGVGAGFAYTTFREPLGRSAYAAIGLAPLIALSLIGLLLLILWPGAPGLTLVFLVGNASGAGGDLWVVWRLRHIPGNCLIVDLADGFAWYTPITDSPAA